MCEYLEEAHELSSNIERTARRGHTCSVCRQPILARTRYTELNSLSDGRWNRARAHASCITLTQHIQFAICGQKLWTYEPQDTPLEALLEHGPYWTGETERGWLVVKPGEVGAAEAITLWRDWIRARGAEDAGVV